MGNVAAYKESFSEGNFLALLSIAKLVFQESNLHEIQQEITFCLM